MNWYVIAPFTIYLAFNVLIGVYGHRVLSRRSKAEFVEEYYVGGRSMGAIVLAFTLTTSLVSAGTFIGTPALGYREGFVWLLIASGQIGAAFLLLGLLGKKFAIVARKVDAYTVPKVLVARFPHPLVGGGSAVVMVLFLSFYMSAQFIGGALIFETISGVPYHVGLLLMVLTTVIYTSIGGFRAVVLTDTMQGAVMLVGVTTLFLTAIAYGGGLESITNRLLEIDPKLITPTSHDAYSWSTIITMGWVLLGISLLGLPHAAVRALAFKDARAMHRAMVLSIIVMFVFTFMMLFTGVAANVVLGPDVEIPDSVIPLTVMALFPPTIAGIVLAAPFAAIMSTVSSMLLVCGSALIGDIYVDAMGKNLAPRRRAVLDRVATLTLGMIVLTMALVPPPFLQAIVFYSIGGLASCFLVPLVFGLYWQRANTYGALAAVGIGTTGYLALATFFPRFLGLHDVTWSIALATIAMVAVSLLTGPPPRDVIEKFWGISLVGRRVQSLKIPERGKVE